VIKEIINKILAEIKVKEKIKNDKPSFNNKYEVNTISINNFKELPDNIKEEIAYVDGGNGEIIHSNSFSLQFIRICAISSKEKIINEFYCFAYTNKEHEEIYFNSKIFQIKGKQLLQDNEIKISSSDKRITKGVFRGNISIIGEIARKIAERKIINEISCNNIVFDGTLEAIYDGEESLLNSNKNLFGLSKSSTLLTENGNNLFGLMHSIKKGKWFYTLAKANLEKHKAIIMAVKLHQNSNFIFRFESKQNDFNSVLSELKNNSTDPIFLGYPYGLIQADKYARVSNKEIEYMKTLIMTKMGNDISKVLFYSNSNTAHSILDQKYEHL